MIVPYVLTIITQHRKHLSRFNPANHPTHWAWKSHSGVISNISLTSVIKVVAKVVKTFGCLPPPKLLTSFATRDLTTAP